jgi:hypothetical protein
VEEDLKLIVRPDLKKELRIKGRPEHEHRNVLETEFHKFNCFHFIEWYEVKTVGNAHFKKNAVVHSTYDLQSNYTE